MSTKKIRDLGFRRQRLGCSQCQIDEFVVRRVQRHVVDLEEDQRRFEPNSLVAVRDGDDSIAGLASLRQP